MRFRRRGEAAATLETETSPGSPTALTAAAQILHSRKIKRAGGKHQKKTASMDWQADAWGLFDEVGELWFAASWTANSMSRVRLHAALLPDGDGDPEPVGEGMAADLMAEWAGGEAGQAAFLSRAGYHLAVVGDSYFVARPRRDTDVVEPVTAADAPLEWQAYSTEEVSYDTEWKVNDGIEEFKITDDDLIIRCWRPHPRRLAEAMSAVRSSIPVLRVLRGLTMHDSAQVDSRLAGAGLLIVPQSIAVPSSGRDQADDEDPFVAELIEAMVTPIKDRDSAAAVVPLVARVPDEAAGKIQHLTFSTDLDDKSAEMQDHQLRRFSIGQDLPADILVGNAEANHWSAWLTDEQSVRAHVAPLAAAVCLALTIGWLQPALAEAGVAEPHRYTVWYSLDKLLHKADRTDTALALHDRMLIGDKAALRETGFSEDDMPSPEELTRMVLITLLKSGGDITAALSKLGVDVPAPEAEAAPLPAPDDKPGQPGPAQSPIGEPTTSEAS